MNEDMVSKWNEVVSPEDTVYYLGDFSMAFRSVELFPNRLNGTKHMILGNHDFAHSYHKKGKKDKQLWVDKYLENGFATVKESDSIEINGQQVLLHHMPYKGKDKSHNVDKYDQYRLEDTGLWLLHGHIHTFALKIGKMINVGVDRHDFKPISTDRIIELMNTEGDIL